MGAQEVPTGTVSVVETIFNETDMKEWNQYDMWNVRHVLEGPLWVPARVFLVPDGVLCMRTTAAKWNIAGLCGPSAELHFFLLKKEVKHVHLPCSERPSLRCDYRQLFDFGLVRGGRASPLVWKTALLDSLGEWATLVNEFRCPNTFPLPYPLWLSSWDVASQP